MATNETHSRYELRVRDFVKVPRSQGFYDDDLAYIHDVGFSGFAEGCTAGLLEILRKAGIHDGLVVDLGCGGGVWARNLVNAGYRVVGIDLSPALVARARQRVPSAEFHVGSIWSHSIPRCRAVTALGEVVSYLADGRASRNLSSLLRQAFDSLEPGGLLIFDLPEVGLDRDRKPTFTEGDDWACLVRFEYEEKRDRLTRHITTFRQVAELFRRARERHVVQLYCGNEIVDLLRQTGFRVRRVRKFGDYPLLPKRVGFIARKP